MRPARLHVDHTVNVLAMRVSWAPGTALVDRAAARSFAEPTRSAVSPSSPPRFAADRALVLVGAAGALLFSILVFILYRS